MNRSGHFESERIARAGGNDIINQSGHFESERIARAGCNDMIEPERTKEARLLSDENKDTGG